MPEAESPPVRPQTLVDPVAVVAKKSLGQSARPQGIHIIYHQTYR